MSDSVQPHRRQSTRLHRSWDSPGKNTGVGCHFLLQCMKVALLNYGYVGCIRDLFIDGQSKDIRQMAEVQSTAGVKPSCSRETAKPCLSNPCKNNGMCRDGWNRYVCDCSGTGYLGRSCERGMIPKSKQPTPLR